MKCDKCKYAPVPSYEGDCDECPHWETHGVVWKDGSEGCTMHPKTLEKLENEFDSYLEMMGCGMALEMLIEEQDIDRDQLIKDCKHMIGFDNSPRIYHRKGKAYYTAYRNGWGNGQTNKKSFDAMVSAGFMTKRVSEQGNVFYHLTKVGLLWLGNALNTIIKEEK